MTQTGNCWLIKFAPQENTDERTAEFFDEYFDVVAVNYTDDGLEEYVGYLSNKFDENSFYAAATAWQIEISPYTTEFLPERNWLKENVIKFAPVNIAEFTVYGRHETQIPNDGRLNLRIYAATAFGSEHPTTKMCLSALSDVRKLLPNTAKLNILDVGCGSGILSLAAARLWGKKCSVIAVDIDNEAVSVTQNNALDNQLEDMITADVSNGYQSALVKNAAPYDLIFANILARPLISMATDLQLNLKRGGYCILSGFVEDQALWVINEHTKLGLRVVEQYADENWRAVLMEKI